MVITVNHNKRYNYFLTWGMILNWHLIPFLTVNKNLQKSD